jgi:hypothetical protein
MAGGCEEERIFREPASEPHREVESEACTAERQRMRRGFGGCLMLDFAHGLVASLGRNSSA